MTDKKLYYREKIVVIVVNNQYSKVEYIQYSISEIFEDFIDFFSFLTNEYNGLFFNIGKNRSNSENYLDAVFFQKYIRFKSEIFSA